MAADRDESIEKPSTRLPLRAVVAAVRWCRRRPVVSLLLVVVTLLTLVAFSGVFWQWRQAEKNYAAEKQARQELFSDLATVQAQKSRADQNLGRARLIIDEIMTDVAANREMLSRTPDTQQLRIQLLTRAERYLVEYIESNQEEEHEFDRERAKTTFGQLLLETGRPDEAIQVLQSCVEPLRRIAMERSDDVEAQMALLACQEHIGSVHRINGDLVRAEKIYDEVIEAAKKLSMQNPDDVECQTNLGRQLRIAGQIKLDLRRTEVGIALTQQGLEIVEQLLSANPNNSPALIQTKIVALNNCAAGYAALSQTKDAERCVTEALELARQQSAANPLSMTASIDLLHCMRNAATLGDPVHDPENRIALIQDCVEVSQTLSNQNPLVTSYQNELAVDLLNLAQAYGSVGDYAAATYKLDEAGAILIRLVDSRPCEHRYRQRYARFLAAQANHYHRLRDGDVALAKLNEAIESIESVIESRPFSVRNHLTVADYLETKAMLHESWERFNEALEAQQRSIAILQKLVDDGHVAPIVQGNLAEAIGARGVMHEHGHDTAAAESDFAQAVEMLERLVANHPSDPGFTLALARASGKLSTLEWNQNRAAIALAYGERTHELFRKLVELAPDNLRYRSLLATSHAEYAVLLAASGNTADAKTQFQRAVTVRRSIAEDYPYVLSYQADFVDASFNLANFLVTHEESSRAAGMLREAVAAIRPLAIDHPESRACRDALANCLGLLGTIAHQDGRIDDAITYLQETYDLLFAELRNQETSPETVRRLAGISLELSRAYRASSDPEAALRTMSRISDFVDRLPDRDRMTVQVLSILADCEVELVSRLFDIDLPSEGLVHANRAITMLTQAAESEGMSIASQYDVAFDLTQLGQLLVQASQLEASAGAFEEARRIHARIYQQDPNDASRTANFAASTINVAANFLDFGDLDTAIDGFVAAKEILNTALERSPDDAVCQFNLDRVNGNLALAYRRRAWADATASEASQRNATRALRDATRACDLTAWQEPACLASLAAAYAENGDFEAAIKHATQAVDLTTDPSARTGQQSILDQLKHNQPIRNTPPP